MLVTLLTVNPLNCKKSVEVNFNLLLC